MLSKAGDQKNIKKNLVSGLWLSPVRLNQYENHVTKNNKEETLDTEDKSS